jgi:hypothetical protein
VDEVFPLGNEAYFGPKPKAPVASSSLDESTRTRAFELVGRGAVSRVRKKKKSGVTWTEARVVTGEGRFDLVFDEKGRLASAEVKSHEGLKDEPGEMVIPGALESIPPDKLPGAVSDATRILFGDTRPTAAWKAECVGGFRFIVMAPTSRGELSAAFTETGRLRAAGDPDEMIEEGGRRRSRPSIDPGDRIEPRFPVRKAVEKIEADLAGKSVFRFVVAGDTRSNFKVYRALVKSISARKPLFAAVTGDLVAKGKHKEFQEYFRPPLEEFAHFHLLPVVGNHDLGKACLGYENLFGQGARFYRIRGAGCLFIIMDNSSHDAGTVSWGEQLETADRWMAEHPGDRKFVFIHKPPSCVEKWAHHAMNPGQSKPFCELMAKHEVDHVYAGHIHAYSTAEHLGVKYTVTGGGGAPLSPYFGKKGAAFHYIVVDIMGDRVKTTGVRLVRAPKKKDDEEDF